MEYNRINYFLKAAQTLNFSRAAEELFISRQALTKQIALFEEELGVKLFERSTRNIKLSKAGQEAYKRLFRASIELDNALDAIRSLGVSERHPKIRFGFFSEIQNNTLQNIIRMVNEVLPDVEIEAYVLELFELRDALLQGKIEICITNTVQGELWENCGKIVLRDYQPIVIVSRNHPWAERDQVTVEDMLREDFIMLKDEDFLDVEGFFENIPCRKQIWRPNTRSVGVLLDQGCGFTVVAKHSSYLMNADMVSFPLPESNSMLEVSCIWNKNKPRDIVDQVVAVLQNMFEV